LTALSHALYRRRLIKFIMRSYKADMRLALDYVISEGNAFTHEPYKKALFSLVLSHRGQFLSELALCSGLLVMALYLSTEKPRWHRMIELVLIRQHGLKLRAMIDEHKEESPDPKIKAFLGSLLIDAMAGAFI
ncbi:MAG TPA: hypothetical protein VEK06_00640, partial [Myxococcota bacterium]|nr:hypothetical protein [Myxococcota bacterium]